MEARFSKRRITGETVEKGHFETKLLFRVLFSDFEITHLLIGKDMVLIAHYQ